jgi:hypothetical protein
VMTSTAVRRDRCGQDGKQPAGAGGARHRESGSFGPFGGQADRLWQQHAGHAGNSTGHDPGG